MIRSGIKLYNQNLRRVVLKHEFWHFQLYQFSSSNAVVNGILRALNEVPAYLFGLISLPVRFSFMMRNSNGPSLDASFGAVESDKLTSELGANQKRLMLLLTGKAPEAAQETKVPEHLVVDASSWDQSDFGGRWSRFERLMDLFWADC